MLNPGGQGPGFLLFFENNLLVGKQRQFSEFGRIVAQRSFILRVWCMYVGHYNRCRHSWLFLSEDAGR